MEAHILEALNTDRVIDITTTGRSTGLARRIEIWFHNVDGTIYITGMPGKRGWYANLLDDPEFDFHLKESTTADLSAMATPVVDPAERRHVLKTITSRVGATGNLDDWVQRSPLVEVAFAR